WRSSRCAAARSCSLRIAPLSPLISVRFRRAAATDWSCWPGPGCRGRSRSPLHRGPPSAALRSAYRCPSPAPAWPPCSSPRRRPASLLLEPGSPREVCQRIVELAGQDHRVAFCTIFLIDQTGEYLYLAATNNPTIRRYLDKPTYRLGEGITGWVAKYREPALV